MILSHVIVPGAFSVYRGSVLDISNTSRYSQFEFVSNVTNLYADNGDFNATFPAYGFGSLEPKDGTPALRTWSNVSGAEFDLSFELSSPVLLNGGLGFFQGADSVAYEWSMPAGKTAGWLSLDGYKVTVDAQKSLTWYDRQWGGAPGTWTWFELHIVSETGDKPDTPLSVWSYNTTSGPGGFATTRETTGAQNVLPVTSLQPSDRNYTSQESGVVYPLDWVLQLGDRTTFHISSVRPDQELHAAGGLLPTYEGYVTLTGISKNGEKLKGYGLVEMSFN